ncbi:MAG TPA: DUF2490 domain-containing protein [Cyclobacteriaceae bacterium]
MRFLLFTLFSLACVIANGQTTDQNFNTSPRDYVSRKSFWTEFNLSGSLSKNGRWQYQMDYQYRRAADASFIKGGDHANIFKEMQQQVFRPWIHYWAVPGAVRLSLSPIGYWITWTPDEEIAIYPNKDGVAKTHEDGTTTGQSVFPEFRICPQVTTYHNIGRFQFIQRYRYEFRFIGERRAADNNSSDFNKGYNFAPTDVGDQSVAKGWYGHNHAGRIRLQTRLQVPLNHAKMTDKTVYINMWNELFVSTGKTVKNEKLLNQNRFVAMLGYRFNGSVPIKIEGGITYQSNFQYNIGTFRGVDYSKANVENNTAFTVYVIFDEFHKLFQKNKEESKI